MKIPKFVHIFSKLFCFLLFGLGGIINGTAVFPLIFLFVWDKRQRERIMRKTIQLNFFLFVKVMSLLKVIDINYHDLEPLRRISGKIICANHPTLLDVVLLMAFVPDANCIVKSALWKNIFIRKIIGTLYIPNSMSSDQTMEESCSSLRRGNNLILFPESTRTRSGQKIKFHRSAAQIAMFSSTDIQPVHIGTVWPSGLGKDDSLFSAPEKGIIEYSVNPKQILSVSGFDEMPRPLAARRITETLYKTIFN